MSFKQQFLLPIVLQDKQFRTDEEQKVNKTNGRFIRSLQRLF